MYGKLGLLALLTTASLFSAALSADRNGIESTRAKIGKYPVIYGITGLRDNGGTTDTGVATTINCIMEQALPPTCSLSSISSMRRWWPIKHT